MEEEGDRGREGKEKKLTAYSKGLGAKLGFDFCLLNSAAATHR